MFNKSESQSECMCFQTQIRWSIKLWSQYCQGPVNDHQKANSLFPISSRSVWIHWCGDHSMIFQVFFSSNTFQTPLFCFCQAALLSSRQLRTRKSPIIFICNLMRVADCCGAHDWSSSDWRSSRVIYCMLSRWQVLVIICILWRNLGWSSSMLWKPLKATYVKFDWKVTLVWSCLSSCQSSNLETLDSFSLI